MPHRRLGYYYGWNIVIACVLSQLAALGVTVNCFSLFVHGWSAEFHTPVSQLALAIAILSLGCSVVATPAGVAIEKHPARWVFGLGLGAVVLAMVMVGFATAGWQIIAIYAVVLPAAVTFSSAIPAQALVTRWFVRKRGTAMGLCAFGLALAGVVFPPIITQLLPTLGWRGTWWLFAGLIGLVIGPVVLFILRDRPTPQEAISYVPVEAHEAPGPGIPFRTVLARPRFWVILAVFLSVQFASMIIAVAFAPIALTRGVELKAAGALLSLYAICALTGKLTAGLLADRFGNRIPFAGVALLAAAGVTLLSQAQGATAIAPAVILVGLAQGHWTLLPSAMAAEFGQRGFPRAYGLVSAFAPIGSLAPPVVAFAYERSGDYAAPLLAIAAIAVCGAATALIGLREPPHPGLGFTDKNRATGAPAVSA